MSDGERYTLAEAKRALMLQECRAHGHDWNIIQTGAGVPTGIVCERCGDSYKVTSG